MDIEEKVVVVTGAASGIGFALARKFVQCNASKVILVDVDSEAVQNASKQIANSISMNCDVTNEKQVITLIDDVESSFGPIDIFCSNAGVAIMGDENSEDSVWQTNWDLHVMAHVYASRILAKRMTERGGGCFVITASAAGLLSHVQSATYSVSKHAAVAFGEWLSICHGDKGLQVQVLCPQAVRTPMLADRIGGVASVDGILEPEDVANSVIDGIKKNQFLILPHPSVNEYLEGKTRNYERWLKGMRKLRGLYKTNT
jgi:NAD(P)-dependent dehydrogenase (short-subunit alcohol dehydrogenase family)